MSPMGRLQGWLALQKHWLVLSGPSVFYKGLSAMNSLFSCFSSCQLMHGRDLHSSHHWLMHSESGSIFPFSHRSAAAAVDLGEGRGNNILGKWCHC